MVAETSIALDNRHCYISEPNAIVAYDQSSGDAAWRFEHGDAGGSSPTVACDTVVVQTGNYAFGLAPDDGTELWKQEFGHSVAVPNVLPTRRGVYVSTLRRIRRLSYDGQVVWHTTVDEGDLIAGVGSAGSNVVAATGSSDTDGTVYCFDVGSGDVKWRHDGIKSYTPPVVGDSRAYAISTTGTLYALSLDDGSSSWDATLGSSTYASPAVDERAGYVYAASGSTGTVVALDGESGAVVWETDVGTFARYEPLVSGDRIYYPGNDLVAIGREDGTVLWREERLTGTGPGALSTDSLWLNANGSLVRVTDAD